jgi:hypothetical protein
MEYRKLHIVYTTYSYFWYILVNVHGLKFREASNDDKSTILSLRHNVYRGLDYLPDQFDYFLHDDNRRCIVGELDGTLVSKKLKKKCI